MMTKQEWTGQGFGIVHTWMLCFWYFQCDRKGLALVCFWSGPGLLLICFCFVVVKTWLVLLRL